MATTFCGPPPRRGLGATDHKYSQPVRTRGHVSTVMIIAGLHRALHIMTPSPETRKTSQWLHVLKLDPGAP